MQKKNAFRILWIGLTLASAAGLYFFADLTPKVQPDFFFSNEDPQYRQDKKIRELFEAPEQLILNIKGDIKSREYAEKIEALTEAISAVPGVDAVQSITEGPQNPEAAFTSALWKRLLITEDGESTNLFAFIEKPPPQNLLVQLEKIKQEHESESFSILISGPLYITNLIQLNLMRDFKTFSLTAFLVFGLVMLAIFRSVWILLGTFIACFNAAALTLVLMRPLNVEIGMLTANLATIVLVLTLSHIVFLTYNWKSISSEELRDSGALQSVRMTIRPSFWSMMTTLLGFGSLIFVEATPLKHLGVSGAVGAFASFVLAYLAYPFFLPSGSRENLDDTRRKDSGTSWFLRLFRPLGAASRRLFGKPRVSIFAAVCAVVLLAAAGISRLNTDPSLLSYFKRGGELRQGLDYIDQHGGSSPLLFVIEDQEGINLQSEDSYKRLWELETDLEQHWAVGSIVSLPLVLSEVEERVPFSFLVPWDWLMSVVEKQPQYTEIARYFLTPDSKRTLFVLRMKESERSYSREAIIEQLTGIFWKHSFQIAYTGGVYLLQSKLSSLVASSLVSGLALLLGLFVVMGLLLSRSLKVTLALFLSLLAIPLWLLGLLGHLGVPLDVIAAPAANIAIAMGVDAMIHMLIAVRRRGGGGDWEHWVQARKHLWKPVFSNMAVICAGFGIFSLSNFPPTQRFGLAVVLGTVMSPVAALFMLPCAAGLFHGGKNALQKKEQTAAGKK